MSDEFSGGLRPRRVHIDAFERLRQLCDTVRQGRHPRKADLAQALGVSERTIQRDLKALVRDFQAPIRKNRARGIFLEDPGWQLPSVRLSEAEMLGFFVAERLVRRLGSSAEAEIVRRALRNLGAYLPQEVVVDLARLGDAIHFAPEPALDTSPEVLQRLGAAARMRKRLRVLYYSAHRAAKTFREVDVLALVEHLGEWYALTWDHRSDDYRTLHAGRFVQIFETDTSFEIPDGWSAEEYVRRGFGMFQGGEEIEVVISFDAYQARYARERKYHPTQVIEELSDGGLRLRFTATEAALEQVARWVMGYGDHAEAIAPPALRDRIAASVKQMVEIYRC